MCNWKHGWFGKSLELSPEGRNASADTFVWPSSYKSTTESCERLITGDMWLLIRVVVKRFE